jgi:hypothetical protein
MLKKVQMTPSLAHRVMNPASKTTAFGTRILTASLKADLDIQTLMLGIKITALHHPGYGKTQSQLKQIGISHVHMPP